MVGVIAIIILAILVASSCLSSGSNSSGNIPRNTYNTRNNTYSNRRCSYYECPSCGAPGYDGYCEECGYPDINQGWIGENY